MMHNNFGWFKNSIDFLGAKKTVFRFEFKLSPIVQ